MIDPVAFAFYCFYFYMAWKFFEGELRTLWMEWAYSPPKVYYRPPPFFPPLRQETTPVGSVVVPMDEDVFWLGIAHQLMALSIGDDDPMDTDYNVEDLRFCRFGLLICAIDMALVAIRVWLEEPRLCRLHYGVENGPCAIRRATNSGSSRQLWWMGSSSSGIKVMHILGGSRVAAMNESLLVLMDFDDGNKWIWIIYVRYDNGPTLISSQFVQYLFGISYTYQSVSCSLALIPIIIWSYVLLGEERKKRILVKWPRVYSILHLVLRQLLILQGSLVPLTLESKSWRCAIYILSVPVPLAVVWGRSCQARFQAFSLPLFLESCSPEAKVVCLTQQASRVNNLFCGKRDWRKGTSRMVMVVVVVITDQQSGTKKL
ncbi:hypothetical protein BDA99DRAFT_531703 [Phascolomyces articulosus]|uniref:Uncharacterized protein n=1 Tax=Phascolomyces articulosus TaxID=60185 RepID=A0AAD5KD61_9FUNG|nr:hypothetical protein BDA99DRAFT_531703 [Phascolomyces articulosus]